MSDGASAMAGEALQLSGGGLFGHLREFQTDRLTLLRRVARECGDLGWIRLGPVRAIIVSDPVLARDILTERHDEFNRVPASGMDGLQRLFGQGLVVSDGDRHRAQRRRVTLALARSKMTSLAPQVAIEVERAAEDWPDDEAIDLFSEIFALSLRMLQRVFLGLDQSLPNVRVGSLLRRASEYCVAEVARALPLPGWVPTPHNIGFRRLVAELDQALFELIARRRADKERGDDLLSALLDAPEGRLVSDLELRDDLMSLFVAGNEALATTMFWSLYHCIVDPELNARVLGRAPLMLDVFKEAMRLYPPNHVMLRRAARDLELSRVPVKAGTIVMLNGYVIHRDPRCFDQPETFLPSRFEAAGESGFAHGYWPFGAGPRTCPGNHFSLIHGPRAVLGLLQSRVFEPLDPDPGVSTGFALAPRHPWRVRSTRRGARATVRP
jgi:cytochrome P450